MKLTKIECPDCEDGTQYLSNYVSQECDTCNGTGIIELEKE